MIKNFLLTVGSCTLFFVYCSNEQKNTAENNKKTEQTTPKTGVMKSYFLNHEIRNVDYEIYINDLLVGQSHDNNGVPGPYKINQYLFSNGKQEVTIKLTANKQYQKEITADLLNEISRNTGIYLLQNKDYGNIQEVKKLEFPKLEKGVPTYEFKWNFDADATHGITNLNNSEDLAKIDKDELLKQVSNKYDQLRNMLHTGNTDQFMKEISKAKNDLFIADGLPESEQQKYNENLKNYFASHKDLLPDFSSFTMKVLGHGRAVVLENIDHNKGMGVLTAEDKQQGLLNSNYIILHKPKGSTSFEVFRYSSSFSELK
ncbi:hypothetical protein ABEG63_05050 [Chryseobacterium sp. C39-AII1]|uniref:hypothetical protein n=1 Tax=Chryseobacterium sp. C39-AII1 TaxID=3080332 RepID=UPI003208F466